MCVSLIRALCPIRTTLHVHVHASDGVTCKSDHNDARECSLVQQRSGLAGWNKVWIGAFPRRLSVVTNSTRLVLGCIQLADEQTLRQVRVLPPRQAMSVSYMAAPPTVLSAPPPQQPMSVQFTNPMTVSVKNPRICHAGRALALRQKAIQLRPSCADSRRWLRL